MEIGAQLYTLKKHLQKKEEIASTLARVAQIGYRNVQLSGMADCDPAWLRGELDKNGLRAVLTHVKHAYLQEKLERVIEAHDILGCPYVGIGTMPGYIVTEERFASFVQTYTPIIARLQQAGKRFFYHNHHFEFVRDPQGTLYMKRLTDTFSPEQLAITLDTYWVQFSGGDPAAWIARLAPRLPCVHLKDLAVVQTAPDKLEQRMAVLGEGNINLVRAIAAAEQAGVEYLLVEQDDCYGEDPFACLQRSYDYLKSLGL